MDVAATVINVGTDAAATLAIASIRAHAPSIPIHLINCGSTDGSQHWFAQLRGSLQFDVDEQPIRSHGEALDGIFATTSADVVLLLDSDAEILDADVLTRSLAAFADDRVFGAGYTDGPSWMGPAEGATANAGVAYFQERPWMPFSLFRTTMVREALAASHTFVGRKVWNDFPPSRGLSALLAARFQDEFVPKSGKIAALPPSVRARIANWRFDGLRWLRRDFHGNRPNYVLYDTGADIYEWCKYQRGWIFAGIDYRLCTEVAHHQGVTRARFGDDHQVADIAEVDRAIQARLEARYGIQFTGCPL